MPATNSITASTYGDSGGFSINVQLTPATAAQTAVLNNAITAPAVMFDPVTERYYITISFFPQGQYLQLAAQTLGVDHFNFVNTITSVPIGWQITDNGVVVVNGNGQTPPWDWPTPCRTRRQDRDGQF